METIKLTAEQVAEIEAKSSSYGCGAEDDCMACYPLEYRCGFCGEDYETPILNGQPVYCDTCGDYNNQEGEPTEAQKELWNRYQTVTKQ